MSFRIGQIIAAILVLAALAAMVLLAVLPAKPKPPADPFLTRKPEAVYTTRAIIDTLPEQGKLASELQLHHEPIPEFKDKTGKIVGMSEMVMGFEPAAGVSLAGLKPGDAVKIEFAVWGSSPMGYRLTKIERLPEGEKPAFAAPK